MLPMKREAPPAAKSAFARARERCARHKGCGSCEDHKRRISELEQEVEDLKDRFIRALADRENLKWRVIRAAKGE